MAEVSVFNPNDNPVYLSPQRVLFPMKLELSNENVLSGTIVGENIVWSPEQLERAREQLRKEYGRN